MIYLLIAQLLSLLLDLCATSRRSERHKDIQILLLRQQLRILQRQLRQKPNVSRLEKLTLAVLASKLTRPGCGMKAKLGEALLLFKSDTVLKWQRDLVRRKWTFTRRRTGGRPTTDPELQALLLWLARENPSWGYSKIQGELLKLGYKIERSTVRDLLKRQHVPPARERVKKGSSWRTFLGHYANQFLACDFFTHGRYRMSNSQYVSLSMIGTPSSRPYSKAYSSGKGSRSSGRRTGHQRRMRSLKDGSARHARNAWIGC